MAALVLLAGLVWPQAAFSHPATFAPLVKKQSPTVVHISTRSSEAMPDEEGFLPFRSPDQFQGMGSGFVLSANGLIVTNHHVIQDAEEIEVILNDERRFKAELVGSDARTDLALLRIQAKKLTPVRFGNSTRAEVGDWVVAIGNPLGLDHSVTVGIISAKGRNIFEAENVAYGEFIQTDAAINPGNSGGPLFNLEGEVIGVNTAISSRGQGISFAIPSNLVVDVVEQLRRNGRVVRGWLGVVIQEVTPEWNQGVGLPKATRGILVNDLIPGAPAASHDIQKGDVLVSFGGIPLNKVSQLQKMVALSQPGAKVEVNLLRLGGKSQGWEPLKLTITLGKAPDERVAITDSDPIERLDIRLLRVPSQLSKKLGLEGGMGVLVGRVNPDGLGAEVGLQEGDVILKVDQQPVADPEELSRILRRNRRSRLMLMVQRKGALITLTLPQWD